MTDDQIQELEKHGVAYVNNIRKVEHILTSNWETYLTVLRKNKEEKKVAKKPDEKSATDTLLANISESIVNTLKIKLEIETMFVDVIHTILNANGTEGNYLKPQVLSNATSRIVSYFLDFDLKKLEYPSTFDSFVHNVTHFPVIKTAKPPKGP